MHSEQRYKIFICSVILGQLWVFSKLQGLQSYFPENFGRILKYKESKTFFIPLSMIAFSNPKVLGFPFSTKNNFTWGEKCEQFKFIYSHLFNYNTTIRKKKKEEVKNKAKRKSV